MAVRSEDLAEPFILHDAADVPTMPAAKVAAVTAASLAFACNQAAAGRIALLAFVTTDEQAEVVRLMVQSAKEALDVKQKMEEAVGRIGKEGINADNG